MVRAKFMVSSIERQLWDRAGSKEVQTVKLSAVTSGSEENKAFFAATPNGRVELSCANPDAAALFELGAEYYLDFSKAE